AAAPREVAHGLRALVRRLEVVDVQRVIGAEFLREREAIGQTVEYDDLRGAALACDGRGKQAESARALDDDGLAGLQPDLVQTVGHLRERAVERRDFEIAERVGRAER